MASPSSHEGRSKRKSTYIVRKEETQKLLLQIEALEQQKAFLSCNSKEKLMAMLLADQEGETHGLSMRDEDVRSVEEQNKAAREVIRLQQLSLWGTQSALSDWLNGQEVNPLATYIHLTRDPQQRQTALVSIKEQVLATAEQFLATRSQFLDPFRPYRTEDRCETTQGHFCSSGFDIIQFEGVQSLRSVWDALLFFLANIEISVSERLNDVTLREDNDVPDDGIAHHRLATYSSDTGITEEMNRAVFARFRDDDSNDQQQQGILTAQFIDVDELYPYSPSTCIRKDITAAISMTPLWRKRRQPRGPMDADDSEHELVVVMRRVLFIKLHHTDLPISQPVLRERQENMGCWGSVMIAAMRDQLYAKAGGR